MVFRCARAAGNVPSSVIVVANEPVRLVFTALMTMVFPSAVRLTVASSTGTFEPWAEVLNVGLFTVLARRTSPRCSL